MKALRPRGLLSPNESNKQERELHDLTHLPYRRWCTVCVPAKGKQSLHPATQDRKPAIQIDFACMSTEEQPGTAVTIFTGIDVRAQFAMAVMVPSQSINRYGLTELKRFIYEKGRTQAVLQCDDENAIKHFAGLRFKTSEG